MTPHFLEIGSVSLTPYPLDIGVPPGFAFDCSKFISNYIYSQTFIQTCFFLFSVSDLTDQKNQTKQNKRKNKTKQNKTTKNKTKQNKNKNKKTNVNKHHKTFNLVLKT